MAQPFFSSIHARQLDRGGNHPPGIRAFLAQEQRVLRARLPQCDALIEVACGRGRHLALAREAGKRYLGVDADAACIAHAARDVAADQDADFLQGTAERLGDILRQEWPFLVGHRCLILFPFSILSAISDLDAVAVQLASLQCAFVASMYATTNSATEARVAYYENCGLTGIRVDRQVGGVHIMTAEGLWTVAYEPAVLDEVWERHGIAARTVRLDDVYCLSASTDHFVDTKTTGV